jgi:hypothetical protein
MARNADHSRHVASLAESRPSCNILVETRARSSMGETGTDTPLEAARRMLDIFASVGAERFHVTWTDSAAHPRRPRSLRRNLRSLGGPLPQTENEDWLDAVHIAGIGAADPCPARYRDRRPSQSHGPAARDRRAVHPARRPRR